jgi:hypothetical protein
MPFFEKRREKIVEERSMGIRATRGVASLVAIALLISLLVPPVAAGKDNIDMSVIRALAQRPVDEILEKSQVSSIEIGNYWSEVRSRGRPMIVFFYSNMHGPSQRVATLILYVAKEYSDRIDFRRVAFAMTSTPAGFIDVTAIPRDDHMSQSFLALLSKLQGEKCLTHVDTEGRPTSKNSEPQACSFGRPTTLL